jgi:hypothetical protein
MVWGFEKSLEKVSFRKLSIFQIESDRTRGGIAIWKIPTIVPEQNKEQSSVPSDPH